MSVPLRAPVGAVPPRGLRRPAAGPARWISAPTGHGDLGTLRHRRVLTRRARAALRPLRLGPGLPCRITVLEDLSGSMGSIAAGREVVLTELLAWLSKHLRPVDEVCVVSFAGGASVRLSPTSAARRLRLARPSLASYNTLLGPSWDAVDAMPAFLPADPHGVRMPGLSVAVLISDGLVADLQRQGGAIRARAVGIDAEALLLPGGSSAAGAQRAPRCWTAAYPSSTTYAVDASDPAALATTLARAVAGLTGRELSGGPVAADPVASVAGSVVS